MPFQSEKQRRFLHANHPEIAKRWERDYASGGRISYDEGGIGVWFKEKIKKKLKAFTKEERDKLKKEYLDKVNSDMTIDEWNALPVKERLRLYFIVHNKENIKQGWADMKEQFNFSTGGILDIDASEEIISDDGNDIELTAYNAEFDDPNDLSTGVRTLFQAKDGGTPQLAKKSKDGKRPGYQGWPGPGAGAPEATSSSTGGGEGSRTRIQEDRAEDIRQQQMRDIIATGPGSDVEKYDTDLVGMTANQKYKARKNAILSKYTGRSSQRKNALTNNYNKERKRLESKVNWAIVPKFLGGLLGGPLTVGWGDLKTAKNIYGLYQLKKDHIKSLTDIKESFLVDVDINNPNEMADLDDTVFPDVMKELKELTKPREEDDPGPHDPLTIELLEEKKEEMEDWDPINWYGSLKDSIRARQAKRAMLVEKDIIQDNPIVGESVTDITMQANSGGLANLFRVKNQY